MVTTGGVSKLGGGVPGAVFGRKASDDGRRSERHHVMRHFSKVCLSCDGVNLHGRAMVALWYAARRGGIILSLCYIYRANGSKKRSKRDTLRPAPAMTPWRLRTAASMPQAKRQAGV